MAKTTEQVLAELLSNPDMAREMFNAMANSEFQAEIAPNLGYKGPIDPSVARWHDVGTWEPVNKQGFQVPEGYEGKTHYSGVIDRKKVKIPIEPGTVNTVGVHNDPVTWSHEYRHQHRPQMSEGRNRVLDGYYAQNETQWRQAVETYRDYLTMPNSLPPDYDEAERELIKAVEYQNQTRNNHTEVMREYRDQREGSRKVLGDDQITTGNWFLDVISPKEQEFAYARKQGQFWNKRKKELYEQDKMIKEVDKAIGNG